jgi:hypothetical protein
MTQLPSERVLIEVAVGIGAEAAVAHSLKVDSKKDGALAHGISDYLRKRFVQGSLLDLLG